MRAVNITKMENYPIKASTSLKTGLVRGFAAIGVYAQFVYTVFQTSFRHPPSLIQIRDQIFNIGIASLPFVAFTGFFIGSVLSAECFFYLTDKGLDSTTGLVVAKAMLLESAPVMTAFVVAGSAGAAMCAEIGTMEVTEQVHALKSMAVEPIRYLVSPRLIGGLVVLPLLTLICSITGVMGGYLVAVHLHHMPPQTFFDPLPEHIRFFDLLTLITKAIVFAAILVIISCHRGLKTEGGAAGVGRATTSSVVISYCLILLANFIVTISLNNFYPYIESIIERVSVIL